MPITQEEAIDMAWRVEGLSQKLRAKGDTRADLLGLAEITTWAWQNGDPTYLFETSYHVMNELAVEFNYDSGKRIYSSEPEKPKKPEYTKVDLGAKIFNDPFLDGIFKDTISQPDDLRRQALEYRDSELGRTNQFGFERENT